MWTLYTIGEKGAYLMAWDFETVEEALTWAATLIDARKHSQKPYLIKVEERKLGERKAPDSLENVNGRHMKLTR